MSSKPENQPQPSRVQEVGALVRTLGGPVLFLVGLVIAGRYAGQFWPDVERTVEGLGYSGYALFVGAWILLSMTCFPVSVLGVSAGALFGPWIGMALVFPAGLAGGTLMYLLGRGLFRTRIKRFIATRPRFAAVDRLAGEQALKLNIMTRLSPLNFGLASYTLGAGRSAFTAYFGGLFAILPSLLAQVWFGSIARQAGRSVDEGGSSVGKFVLLGVGLLFFGLLTWLVSRMVKQAWDEASDEDEQPQDNGILP